MWAWVAYLCLAWYVTIWSICLLGLSLARSYVRPSTQRPTLSLPRHSDVSPSSTASASRQPVADDGTESDVPAVSILRPLSSFDCNLVPNLTSSFLQTYPAERYEILLSIKDTNSSESQRVYAAAKDVIARFPHIQARIIVGDEVAGVNPKINNLVRPYSEARYDILWIVDSQVCSPPGALVRAVQLLTAPPHERSKPAPAFLRRRPHGSRTGLVHHVPFAVLPRPSWGSQLERIFLCTTHAKMYMALNALAIDSCVMGKSNMFRKSDLERVPDSFFEVGSGGSRGESGAIGSAAFTGSAGAGTGKRGGGEGGGEDEAEQPLLSVGYGGSADSPTASGSGSTTPRRTAGSRTTPPPSSAAPDSGDGSTVRTSSRALARFGIYLAEDNMVALSLWRQPLDLSHTLAHGDVAYTSVGDIRSLGDYARRRMRWIRVRKHMVLAATLAEPLTESIIAGLVGLGAFRHFLEPLLGDAAQGLTGTAAFFALHFGAWACVDLAVLISLRGEGARDEENSEPWRLVVAWCLRELLALPIWAWAVSGSTVQWRDRRYRVLSDGRAANISLRPDGDGEHRRKRSGGGSGGSRGERLA